MTDDLLSRYLAPGETWERLCERVSGIMQYEDERKEIFEQLYDKRFLPNSPCLINASRPGGRNLMACHLLHIPDSIEGIFNAVRWAATIFKSGGGIGIELSDLSPQGTPLKYAPNGAASGPVSFLKVFNSTSQAMMVLGIKHPGMMATLNTNHPDIEQFITCKTADGKLSNFNISVTLDRGPSGVPLKLWDKIVELAHLNGEPGVVFLDNVNSDNPTLEDFGSIKGVNTCSEVPLYNFGSCCLASVVLPNAIENLGDWSRLNKTVRLMTQFLNRVIDVNHYPLPQIAQATRRDRRIGIGVIGWSDLLEREEIPFVSNDAKRLANEICRVIFNAANDESIELANKDGGYLLGRRRNAVLMAIAPTGHISKVAEVSPSIYPPYDLALTMTPQQHLDHICSWDAVDNGISYTVCFQNNAPEKTVDEIYRGAWERGLKSISCYRDGSREGQPLCKLDGNCN
jgi:ribonucleoside-diphosphate reductase alpha chain